MTLTTPAGPDASRPHESPTGPAGHDVRSWIDATRRELAVITDEAGLEAELLVRHVTGMERASVYAEPGRAVSAEQERVLRELTERRLRREPLPYILGEWEFRGLSFRMTPAVMIPRPETETLVEEALAWRERRRIASDGPVTIVDVGTGSGCIAVSLAAALPGDRVIAADVSRDALAVAGENAARHGVEVRLLESDLLSAVTGPVDLIVANLPYIPDAEVASLQPEVRLYEPSLALGGGPDGLSLIRLLLVQAQSMLSARGAVMLEINPPQSASLPDEARALFPGAEVRVVKDLAGLDRVVVIDLAGRGAA